MNLSIRSFAAVAATTGVLLLSGCGAFNNSSTTPSEYASDSAITAKIKGDYVANDQVSASAVSVETLNGTVLLSGFVKSSAEKSRAEEIARATKGVKSVKNAIVVRN